MAKILLVEDDSNLREIYSARLEAEGYQIVSANDGEEALAIAVREKPDLIISDIMMPKISGFDMLDILRSTPDTKNIKVIVMTALSQEEDRQRGEKLGANRYVVKSQVTLDDVVTMVKELLAEDGLAPTPTKTPAAAADTATPAPTAIDTPVPAPPVTTTVPVTVASDTPVSTPAAPAAPPIVDKPTTPVAPTPATDNTPAKAPAAADTDALSKEVEEFVATSPLMNGTPPEKPTASPGITATPPNSEPTPESAETPQTT